MNKAAAAGAVIIGLGACVTGAAAWSGHAVGKRLEEQSHALTKVFPTFKVVKEQHGAGLFSSSYDVALQLGCLPDVSRLANPLAGGPAQDKLVPIELGFHHEIKHGPLPGGSTLGIASVDSKLVLPEAWQARVEKVIGKQPLLAIHTTIDFAGNYESELKLPGVKANDPAQGHIELKPVSIHARGKGAEGGVYPYAADIANIELATELLGEKLLLKITDVKTSGEIGHEPGSLYWFGDSKTRGSVREVSLVGSIPSIDGGPAKPLEAQLSALTMSGSSSLDKGLWSTTSSLSAKGKVNDTSIDKLELEASMKRIEAIAYQRLIQSVLSTSLSCDPAARATAADTLLSTTSRQAASLLKHDPEYGVDRLAVELGGRRAELSYSIGSKGVTDADLAAGNPEVLTGKLVLRGAAKIHVGLIDQAVTAVAGSLPPPDPSQAGQGGLAAAASAMPSLELVHATLDQFVELGFLVRDGEYVSFAAAMDAGQLSINGKPMQLPGFGLPSGP